MCQPLLGRDKIQDLSRRNCWITSKAEVIDIVSNGLSQQQSASGADIDVIVGDIGARFLVGENSAGRRTRSFLARE